MLAFPSGIGRGRTSVRALCEAPPTPIQVAHRPPSLVGVIRRRYPCIYLPGGRSTFMASRMTGSITTCSGGVPIAAPSALAMTIR